MDCVIRNCTYRSPDNPGEGVVPERDWTQLRKVLMEAFQSLHRSRTSTTPSYKDVLPEAATALVQQHANDLVHVFSNLHLFNHVKSLEYDVGQ